MVGVARVLFLFLFRRPVQARTCGSDLAEMQRRYDGDMYQAARFDGKPTSDDIPMRGVLARVAYEVDGIEHRTDVCLITYKGESAETAPVIWYNPSCPSEATGIGIGPAVAIFLLSGALVVIGYHCSF
jgi:hypothetical protein